jgi:hypothetical protein
VKIHWIAISLGTIALCGLGLGWLAEPRLMEHPASPLVLVGSGNVFSFIEERVPLINATHPLWLDIGSVAAQQQAFTAFNYGQFTGSTTRVGFIALSSEGSIEVNRPVRPGQPVPNQDSNFWLAIRVAQPPLAVLYRGREAVKQIKPTLTESYPPAGPADAANEVKVKPYHIINFTNLRSLINSPPTPSLTRYLPEEGTGTRNLLVQASKKGTLNWPDFMPSTHVEEVPDYFEELDGDFSFVEVVSYPQASQDKHRPPSCNELDKLNIKSAVICADSDGCDALIPADYQLIIKLSKAADSGNSFNIMNAGECQVAQSLVKEITKCQVKGKPEDHIIMKQADLSSSPVLPSYLSCPTR